MGSERRNHLLIACRYVPYDQWFLTKISPSWKIKHVKESLIAKAFNLPFDRRWLTQDTSIARPPSPITFAPQDSEFSTGLGNHEIRAETRADYKVQGQGDEGGHLANDPSVGGVLSEPSTASQANRDTEAVSNVEPPFAEDNDQIHTSIFTLIRFSTGQILEEHFFVSWYNLGPHELVELHCSTPPPTFARALVFGHMLINAGSMTVDIPIPGSHTASSSSSDRYASDYPVQPTVASKPITATLRLAPTDSPGLTGLPRHDLVAYTEPYWEGWVRLLCVMWRPDTAQTCRLAEASSPSGPPFFSENPSDLERRGKADILNCKWTKVNEWRERWAVIRNGVLKLCKSRDDPTCTRLPLSALDSVCGAEYFSFGHSDNNQRPVNLAGSCSGGDNYQRSSHSNLSPVRARRSASVSDPLHITTPVKMEAVGTGRFLLTATSSNSPTAPRILSPLITQTNLTRVAANANSPLLTTPVFSNHNYSNTLLPIDPERSRRERATVREMKHERMQKEMTKKARLDKQVEHIKRWDDFGIAFGGKSKAKGKEREKDRSSGKDREEKRQKTKPAAMASSSLLSEAVPEKDRNRERQHEKEGQRGKLQHHHRDRFFHPDDRHIPASREEAIAQGMLIVSAKFKIDNVDIMDKMRIKTKGSAPSLLRDTGLSPSVAGNEGGESGRRQVYNRLDKDTEWQRSQVLESSPYAASLPPPRKASLPGLSLTMLSSGGNITPSGGVFGGLFGNKGKEVASVEKFYKRYGSDARGEEEKNEQHGKLDETNDLRSLNLSINTTSERGTPSTLCSPHSAKDLRLGEGTVRGDRRGYHLAGYADEEYSEQRINKQEGRRTKEDGVEWIVLDMGTEIAYNSFIRVLHRCSPPSMQSSFVHQSDSPLPSPLPYSALNVSPHQDIHGVSLALPYPEWRHEVIFRGRSQGMRELGRPLELALFNRSSRPAKERRKHESENEMGAKGDTGCRIPSKKRTDDMSETAHGSDNDLDNALDLESLMLDDSDDESEDESARWWQDIPRQFSSGQIQHSRWATSGQRDVWSRAEENSQYSSSSPTMSFTDPFAFSTNRPDSSQATPSSPAFGLNMEEWLRPSISSSTLASNITSSSTSGMPWNNSPESHQFRTYPRRIVSPSQTLSSPSSNESLGNPYHRFPSRPFSPNTDFHLSHTHHQSSGSPSVLHHSASMPNASALRSMPSAGGGAERGLIRERTVTAPTFFSKPILTAAQIHQIEADVDVQQPTETHHDPLLHDDSASISFPNRPILTPAQIHQIETETEARVAGDYTGLTHGTPSFGTMDGTINHQTSVSVSQQQQLMNDRHDDAGLEHDSGERPQNVASKLIAAGDFGGRDRSLPWTRGSINTDYAPISVLNSASTSAQAILRRVRSGSSLQTPMEVHFEEYEEEGGRE